MTTTTPAIDGRAILHAALVGMSRQLNTIGREHGLKPLYWSFTVTADEHGPVAELDGHAGADYDETEIPAVVEAWATALGLPGREQRFGWTYEATGSLPDLAALDRPRVRIWGCTDTEAMETHARRRSVLDEIAARPTTTVTRRPADPSPLWTDKDSRDD